MVGQAHRRAGAQAASTGAPRPAGRQRRRQPRRAAAAAAALAVAVATVVGAACGGGAIPSPYPAARATEPVEDESGLAGAGAAAGATGAGGSTTTDTGGGTGQDTGTGQDGGGQDGNTLAVGLHFLDGGRRLLAAAPAGDVAWVAALSAAPHGGLEVSLWPRSAAAEGAEAAGLRPPGAAALHLSVPAAAPLGVPLMVVVDGADPERDAAARPEGPWGRLRLDVRPPSGALAADAEAVGEFESHGPEGSLAGRFRALLLAQGPAAL